MKTKLVVLAGILACSASLQAGTAYLLDFGAAPSGVQYDGGYAISPYTGTVNNVSVQLYCVDFNDSITFGTNDISVYSTALLASSSVLQAETRYGKNNAPGNTYTAGTTLYEEMAWLATQMQHTAGTTNAAANNKAIQEAIWTLSEATTSTYGGVNSPHNATGTGYGGTAASGLTGSAQSYQTWINDAIAYVAGFNSGTAWSNASSYYALVPSDWYIITAVNSAGCTVGGQTGGCTGANIGNVGSGSGVQEFLAYKTGGLVTSTTNSSATPEPATFALIGSGLLAGALIRRRRKA